MVHQRESLITVYSQDDSNEGSHKEDDSYEDRIRKTIHIKDRIRKIVCCVGYPAHMTTAHRSGLQNRHRREQGSPQLCGILAHYGVGDTQEEVHNGVAGWSKTVWTYRQRSK